MFGQMGNKRRVKQVQSPAEKQSVGNYPLAVFVSLSLFFALPTSLVLYYDYQRKKELFHYGTQIAEQSNGTLRYREEERAFYFDSPLVEGELTPQSRNCRITEIYENHIIPIPDSKYFALSCTLHFEELETVEAKITVPEREISENEKRFLQVLQKFDSSEKMYVCSQRFESQNVFVLDLETMVKKQ